MLFRLFQCESKHSIINFLDSKIQRATPNIGKRIMHRSMSWFLWWFYQLTCSHVFHLNLEFHHLQRPSKNADALAILGLLRLLIGVLAWSSLKKFLVGIIISRLLVLGELIAWICCWLVTSVFWIEPGVIRGYTIGINYLINTWNFLIKY